ncbi:uncharacterized protein [Epargyreus clarus]|uniref:uncharacterized protein n=1 Tax=Epargyreus clarus TaxID=520877 RepID=UPI003C2F24DE
MAHVCAFECDNIGTLLHVFPNPDKFPQRFKAWVDLVGGTLETSSDVEFYRKKQICDIHFADEHRNRFRRLNALAVPTLHLPGGPTVEVSQKSETVKDQSISPTLLLNKEKTSHRNEEETSLSGTDLQNANTCDAVQILCRICLQTPESATNLFSEAENSKDILRKIYECFQISLFFEEHLPSMICDNCIKELHISYNFRSKCLTYEERFSRICKEKKSSIFREQIISPKDTRLEENSVDLIADTINISNDSHIETDEVEINKEYKCIVCNKNLKSKGSLLRHNMLMHEKRKHLGKVTGFGANRRYHCTKCSYSTPHSQTLVNHMRRHNGDRPYTCECGKNFTQYASLAAHRKTHSAVTYYTCATCGKQFKHAFTLKKHLSVHESGKYTCEVCHKNLKSTQSLRDHMHRHYNIRNYNCEDCGDTFVTCSELLNHKKKHTEVKKIECHLCGYKTHTKKNLIIHLKRHTGDKSFKCGLCELTFYTSSGLRLHHRVHTREKPFTCPTCAQRFTHSTSLNKHMRTVHGLNYKWGDYKSKELNRNKKSMKLNIRTT